MFWQRLKNSRLQQVLPPKRASVLTKDHLKYGLFMENYAKLHKNPITALIEERHLKKTN
jgi:hypothetical protein